MAVALCDADKDLIYPIVALFSKLWERISNQLKIAMVHFTSVGFCYRIFKAVFRLISSRLKEAREGNQNYLCGRKSALRNLQF